MEEMREAAMACYANMSNDDRQLVVSFFNSIDADGDGKVSTAEYLDFLKTKGGCQMEVPQNLFKHLDANNDGTLDFEECVTFYYLITTTAILQPNKPNKPSKREKLKRRTKKVLKFSAVSALQLAGGIVFGYTGN